MYMCTWHIVISYGVRHENILNPLMAYRTYCCERLTQIPTIILKYMPLENMIFVHFTEYLMGAQCLNRNMHFTQS